MFGMQNKLNFNNLTLNEQDYIKAIFQLTYESDDNEVGTNKLAEQLSISPGSVNLMVKKLKNKDLVNYEKYGKISLTNEAKQYAIKLIRKHRLWEKFLCDYLNFTWDEVHQIAEQLEHIESEKLIDRLDEFMNFPNKDPHGSIIPSKSGKYSFQKLLTLSEININKQVKVISIDDSDEELLKYASQIGIKLNSEIKIIEKRNFDDSLLILINNAEVQVTTIFANNIFVK
jgi:DtxR family Mn-dependent transcriptional regulator